MFWGVDCHFVLLDKKLIINVLLLALAAVVLMEGGNEEDLDRLAKLAEEDAEEEEGEVDTKSKGTLAGLIDSSAKSSSSKNPLTTTPKSPVLSKKAC